MEKEKRLWAVITVLIIGGAASLTVGFVMIEWMIVMGGLLSLIGAVCVHAGISILRLKIRYRNT
ncbi:unnamed protein product [marine sediment metagenome]|uniref:Uncharacterized protein n=1 Tax=marine sediment metagenome TaxID=412755 RepID=X1LBY0_9ZZZZ